MSLPVLKKLVLAVMAVSFSTPAFCASGVNILPEGDFEKGKSGAPEGFQGGGYVGGNHRNRINWVSESGGKFIRVEANSSEDNRLVTWTTKPPIPVSPTWREVTVKFKVRTNDEFKVGAESWHDARVIVSWLGEEVEGENVIEEIPIKATRVPVKEWKEVSESFKVPKGAVQLKIQLGTWGAIGEIDFDDLEVIAK